NIEPGMRMDAYLNAGLRPLLGALLLLVVLNEAWTEKRWGLSRYLAFLEANGKTFVELVGILAGCGLLIGAFSLTGVISSLANDMLTIAGNNALLLLAMAAVTSMILGLGLTTTACYIFLAILVGPALEKAGLNKMAVHMFVFYWGMLSSITPPVAIASFAAAGIAGSPPMQTGWESMRVGSIIYFIPFFFVLNPAFVLQAPLWESLVVSATAAVGIVFICAGLQGYQLLVGDLARAGRAEWPLRILLGAGGFLLAAPGGGIMPLGHGAMTSLAVAILAPAFLASLWAVRRA
ncbi:MAG: TRAP transporter large permease subunit, partial [Betaproteobacteria bacterium]